MIGVGAVAATMSNVLGRGTGGGRAEHTSTEKDSADSVTGENNNEHPLLQRWRDYFSKAVKETVEREARLKRR